MEHDLDLTAAYRAEDGSAEQSLTALSHLAEQSAKITAVVARGQENVNVGYMILGFQPDLDRSSQQTREKWQSIRSGVGALMQANQQMFYNMADIVKELRQIASRCAQLQEDIESSTLNQAQAKAALAMIDQVLKNVESAREHVNGITRLDSDLFEKVASDSSSFLKEVGAEWVTLKSNTIRELRQRLDDLDREEIAKYEQVWTVRTDAAQKKARAEQSSIEVAQLREHLEFTRSRRRLIQEQQRLLEAKTEAEIERLQGQVSSLAADLARRQEEMREASVQRLKDVEAAYKKRQEEIQASTAALQQELQNIK